MELQAWVKTADPKWEWTRVLLEGIENVDDLKEAIKKKMEPELKGYAPASFIIICVNNWIVFWCFLCMFLSPERRRGRRRGGKGGEGEKGEGRKCYDKKLNFLLWGLVYLIILF
ncbi:hypothetical protein L211DRAFT_67162 [Terfezia boudieri ATCC MYA-4762]|uniref:Uncharacterized protein n=1 Tax=Terfezia boudieri ATCC MYA-4762 TaxID=1051890 RepID=A0A3N4LSS8_9PEZI|nr:hypothetical protein L211DRAFT_67162 [Terfezia boudieri ATCC MYA-4762]